MAAESPTATAIAIESPTCTPEATAAATRMQPTVTEPGPTATATPREATATPEPSPTHTPEPTPALAPSIQDVAMVAHGFGQDGSEVGFAFVVENANPGHSVESSRYQLAFYDDEGTVVETDSGYIDVLLPGQTLGVAGEVYVDEGVTVSRLGVQLLQGDAVPSEPLPSFTTSAGSMWPGHFALTVTGTVGSPYQRDLEDVRVYAIPYNEVGAIVGGGLTFLSHIPAGGTTGVELTICATDDVERVELYASTSSLTWLGRSGEVPEGAVTPILTKQGFGQEGWEVGFGFLVENPNQSHSLESSRYRITLYREDGIVLGTEEGYVHLLLPGETLGAAGTTYVPEGEVVARVEVQLLAGTYHESEAVPAFGSENVVYRAGHWSDAVTGEVISPYDKDATDVRVSAITYDMSGAIIGGGVTYLDFVPAVGRAAVEVGVVTGPDVAGAELYTTMSWLSDLR